MQPEDLQQPEGQHTLQKGVLRVCCANPANLGPPERLTPTLEVRVCRVCGRRHFEAEAPPGNLGIQV